jgi:hypothetical protein
MLRDMKEMLGAVEHCENVKGHQELFSSNNGMLGNIKKHWAMLGKRWEMSKQNVGEEGHHEDTKGEYVCLATL